MMRIILLMVAACSGCMHIQPIGPLAETLGTRQALPEAPDPEPIIRQAGKPTPPALYVTPGEITAATAADAAKRLQQELDTDRRALEAMPVYSEVSNVK